MVIKFICKNPFIYIFNQKLYFSINNINELIILIILITFKYQKLIINLTIRKKFVKSTANDIVRKTFIILVLYAFNLENITN